MLWLMATAISEGAHMSSRKLSFLMILLAVGWLHGCYQSNRNADGDGDADADSDVDSDADSDSDGDADTDGDIDGDADSDGDVDGDADSDGDVDGDGDIDADADLVVHEWGVFTGGMARSSARTWLDDMADKPVLYFYTDEVQLARVSVDFPGGQASETWPEISLGPSIGWSEIQIEPEPCTGHTPFPSIGEGQCEDRWRWQCEATELHSYTVPEADCLQVGETVSPLLFYSGSIASGGMPLTGSYCTPGVSPEPPDPADPPMSHVVDLNLFHRGERPLGSILLVYRNIMGDCSPWEGCTIHAAYVAVARIGSLAAGESAYMSLETTLLFPDEGRRFIVSPEWLVAEEASIRGDLIDEGLTESEAEALLAGWNHTFFDLMPDDNFISVPIGESVMAVYVLPRDDYDELLPIQIEPRPRELVRVGLGVEFLPLACDEDS